MQVRNVQEELTFCAPPEPRFLVMSDLRCTKEPVCAEAGLVKLGKVSLDGTKIRANASLSANRTLKRLEQEKVKAQKAQQDKIDKRKAKEESTGKKSRGRKPKSPKRLETKMPKLMLPTLTVG